MKTEALKRLTRDDTEHCFEYYLADEVDALLAEKLASVQCIWVGLTDEERDDLLDTYITAEGRARAIEAKLKEKNA